MKKFKRLIEDFKIAAENKRISKNKKRNIVKIDVNGISVEFCAIEGGTWTHFRRFDTYSENIKRYSNFFLSERFDNYEEKMYQETLEYISDAYIGNIAHILASNFSVNRTYFGKGGELEEYQNPLDKKFSWRISYQIERHLCDFYKDNRYETWRTPNATATIKSITTANEKHRKELHKYVINHPHFEMLDKLWIEKTGHKLNWFNQPTSSLTGEFIFENGKWVKAKKVVTNPGWYSWWDNSVDGKEVMPRKFAA